MGKSGVLSFIVGSFLASGPCSRTAQKALTRVRVVSAQTGMQRWLRPQAKPCEVPGQRFHCLCGTPSTTFVAGACQRPRGMGLAIVSCLFAWEARTQKGVLALYPYHEVVQPAGNWQCGATLAKISDGGGKSRGERQGCRASSSCMRRPVSRI